jgi:hypothetical protein
MVSQKGFLSPPRHEDTKKNSFKNDGFSFVGALVVNFGVFAIS